MGSVNTGEIRSLVEDVKSNIGVFNSYVEAAIKCSNEVKAKAEILKSYNDKIVSDSEVIDNVFYDGYLRDEKGNIGVALGSHFGPIGSKFIVQLEEGTTFPVVKIEDKADEHTYDGYIQRWDKSVIEFVVETDNMEDNRAANGYIWSGNFNNNPDFKGKVVAMYKFD